MKFYVSRKLEQEPISRLSTGDKVVTIFNPKDNRVYYLGIRELRTDEGCNYIAEREIKNTKWNSRIYI